MEVYSSLTAAVANHLPTDTRRIYKVDVRDPKDHVAFDRYFVIATSPATAALAAVGEDHVEIVSRTDRYTAMQHALQEAIDAQNAKVAKGDGK